MADIAPNMIALAVAMLPLVYHCYRLTRQKQKLRGRIAHLERVVDQCALIIKPEARRAGIMASNLSRPTSDGEYDKLWAASRAIDVVREARHGS